MRVYDGGHMPTAPDRFYLCHPCEADGAEIEGGPWTADCDGSATLAVDFLGHVPAAGDYAVATAAGGRWVAEVGSGGAKVCVVVCRGMPVAGALVEVLDSSGAVLVSCTTGATGCCAVAASGSRRVRVTVSGSVVYDATRTLSGTVTIGLGSAAGVVCCGPYAIPEALTLTDGAGSIQFLYWPNDSFPIWFGGHSVRRASCPVTTPNNVCVVHDPTDGPVKVCYQMVCFSGQDPAFSIQRSWSWVYQQGTLTPIWYQDGSGITPGLPCVTSPPAICGSPLTDTAGFTANPSSTSPFILSGTPVAASANSTVDPVGGSVAISA